MSYYPYPGISQPQADPRTSSLYSVPEPINTAADGFSAFLPAYPGAPPYASTTQPQQFNSDFFSADAYNHMASPHAPGQPTAGTSTGGSGQGRSPNSCQQCKIRKLRCDRFFPCDHCKKAGYQCDWKDGVPQGNRRLTSEQANERVRNLEERVTTIAYGGPYEPVRTAPPHTGSSRPRTTSQSSPGVPIISPFPAPGRSAAEVRQDRRRSTGQREAVLGGFTQGQTPQQPSPAFGQGYQPYSSTSAGAISRAPQRSTPSSSGSSHSSGRGRRNSTATRPAY